MKKALIPFIILLVLGGFILTQCAGGNNTSNLPDEAIDYWEGDSVAGDPALSEQLKDVMMTIVYKDKERFASLMSYPIQRPYPLHNIKDSASLMNYFDTLVDDSLINILKNTKLSDWSEAGWQGFTFDDGKYFWFDGGIVGWNYISAKENQLLYSQIQKEWATLPESLKGEDWTVYDCLIPEEGPYQVIRLDCRPNYDEEDQYRLSFYKKGATLVQSEPDIVMLGRCDIQESGETQIFSFHSEDNSKTADFIYSPVTYLDEEGMELNLNSKKGTETFTVRFGYWLDLIK